MAKAKKLEKLSDEELLAPMPLVANPVGELTAPAVSFEAQKVFLEARINQVLSEEMTEANLERVQKLKKGVVGWRTSFDKQTKDYMKAAFKAPMDVYKAAAAEVLAEIDTMEAKLDEVLDKEEEKRRDNLNMLFDGIEEELQDTYKLPDRYKERVERKKEYYNKTAKMADVAADIKAQYESLSKEYKNYTLSVKTITSLCSSDKRLNTQMYIDHLEYSELPEIMEEIDAEKARLAALDSPYDPLEPGEDGKIHIGAPAKEVEPEEVPLNGVTKTMTLEITYDTALSDYLTEVFAKLGEKGIKQKVISVRESVPKVPIF